MKEEEEERKKEENRILSRLEREATNNRLPFSLTGISILTIRALVAFHCQQIILLIVQPIIMNYRYSG